MAIFGYARCSTDETRQDINRQVRELKAAGANDGTIYLEYQSSTKDRVELNKVLLILKSGDTLLATEVSRITRSTKHLCEIIEMAKIKQVKLILGNFVVDCTSSLDPMTEELLAWALSKSLEIDFVLETVNQLIKNHRISLTAETLINSDQGSHYTSIKFIRLIKDSALRQSMSRRANCWDNAPQESFYGHMKDEIDISQCRSFEDIYRVVSDWTDYYNNDRYQWDLARLTPREYCKYLKTGEYPLNIPKAKGED